MTIYKTEKLWPALDASFLAIVAEWPIHFVEQLMKYVDYPVAGGEISMFAKIEAHRIIEERKTWLSQYSG